MIHCDDVPELVAGDVGPALDFTMMRRVRHPVTGTVVYKVEDLADAVSAVGRVKREGAATIERALAFHDRPNGVLRLTWQLGDLVAAAGQRAAYDLEVTIDGETTPEPFRFYVRPRL